jgi:hypothetical protein
MKWFRQNREVCANIVLAIIVIGGIIAGCVAEPAVAPLPGAPPKSACPAAGRATARKAKSQPDKIAGARRTLTISVSRDGHEEYNASSPLAIQGGKRRFRAGTVLCTVTSDFVRSDGLILPASQISSQALVSNDGTDVTVGVWVAPRYGQVSGFGSYTGTVSLNDSRATGASIPVKIFVEYPYVNRVLLCGLLLAFAGLIWGLLVRKADKAFTHEQETEPFFANVALRVAVLATAIPIANTQVFSKPGWTGSLSEYIALGGLVGAAAIAATPTLRAIVSRLPAPDRGP